MVVFSIIPPWRSPPHCRLPAFLAPTHMTSEPTKSRCLGSATISRSAPTRGETVIGTAGSDHQVYRIRLRSVTVGGLVMNNIPALVGCPETLLGQIYLKGLKSYAIDNERRVLVMIPPTPRTSMPGYSPPSTYAPPPTYSSPPAYTPSPSTYSPPPAYSQAFVDGRRDRQAWESWFNEVPEGTYKEGADYWSSVRSTAQAAIGCRGSRYIDTYEQQTWANGCEAARARLDHSDRRRNNEPDYKAGWNGL